MNEKNCQMRTLGLAVNGKGLEIMDVPEFYAHTEELD